MRFLLSSEGENCIFVGFDYLVILNLGVGRLLLRDDSAGYRKTRLCGHFLACVIMLCMLELLK